MEIPLNDFEYVPRDFNGIPETYYQFIKLLDIDNADNVISPFSSSNVKREDGFYEKNYQPIVQGYYLASASDLKDAYLEKLMLDHLELTDSDFYPPLSTYFEEKQETLDVTDFLVVQEEEKEQTLEEKRLHKRNMLKLFLKDREDFNHLLIIKREECYYKPDTIMEVDGEKPDNELVHDYKDTIVGFTSYKAKVEMEHPETKEKVQAFLIRTTSIIPSHRNLGIAKRLYHHLEHILANYHMRKHGVQAILRRTWSTNKTQQHLYHKTGFKLWYKDIDGRSPGVHNLYYVKYLKE